MKKNTRRKTSTCISVRLSSSEYTTLKAEAAANHRSIASELRSRIAAITLSER